MTGATVDEIEQGATDPALIELPARRRTPPPWVWLLAIMVVALAVRVWRLDALGFNSDETVYAGQAASIAGNAALQPFFPVFRAHPLLFQTLLSIPYHLGVSDLLGRLYAVAFGLGTVYVTYLLGRQLYSRSAGLVAAAVMAVMPYHVVVSRQVLLDGPMVFFATLSLLLLALAAESRRPIWLYAMAASLGMAFLAKETSIVLVGAVYAFLVLTPEVRFRARELLVSAGVLVTCMLPYPISLFLSKRTGTGQQFLSWQVFRRPNHSYTFYLTTVPWALGLLVIVAAGVSLYALRREHSWRERLLLSWVVVPLLFFEAWPVKGYQYLLPMAAPLAVLAARGLARLPWHGAFARARLRVPWRIVTVGVAVVVGVSLVVPTWRRIDPAPSTTFLAGSGGVAGGRETGRWVGRHVPDGAQLLALGPSMANIIQFYGRRKTYGLSVSPNPLHRNPVYEPVPNPDRALRTGSIQYLVWDAYSAERSPAFSKRLLALVHKYGGAVVYRAMSKHGSGAEPLIVVYSVRP